MNDKRIDIIPVTRRRDGSSLNEKKKYRVAAYARVSTDINDQLNSLETQVEFFNSYISKNPDWKLVKIYADEGISGLSRKYRDSFNQMVDDAKAGKIDIIICKSISRFARNVVDTLTVTRELKLCNVRVFFQKENIDTFDPNGEFLLGFMASFAEEEVKSISHNITWSFRRLFREGKCSVPYNNMLGFRNGREKYSVEIVKEEVPTVRLIYRLFLQGHPGSEIPDILTAMGLKPPSKDKWYTTTIRSILTNEKYCGDALIQKTYSADIFTKKRVKNNGVIEKYYVRDEHEAIIPHETFDEVQLRMRNLSRGNEMSRSNLLVTKIRCTQCGSTYRAVFKYDRIYEQPLKRWICRNKFSKKNRCCSIPLSDGELTFGLEVALDAMKLNYTRVLEDVRKSVSSTIREPERLRQIQGQLEDMSISYDGDMLDAFYRVAIREIRVYPERRLEYVFIDGYVFDYMLPLWYAKEARPYIGSKPVHQPEHRPKRKRA